jgi:hypothetical protein
VPTSGSGNLCEQILMTSVHPKLQLQTAQYIHEVLLHLALWADQNQLSELGHRLRLAACEAAQRTEDLAPFASPRRNIDGTH